MVFNGAVAVLMAHKYCRTSPLFRWREEALPAMGKRDDKFHFLVDMLNLRQDECGEVLLSLLPVQSSYLDFQKENTLYKLKALLVTLKVRICVKAQLASARVLISTNVRLFVSFFRLCSIPTSYR